MLYNFNVSDEQREDIAEIRALNVGSFRTQNFFVFFSLICFCKASI